MIFHQADVRKVRNLGAADAEVNPPHHIAKNALRILPKLVHDSVFGQGFCQQWWLDEWLDLHRCTHAQLRLTGHDVDAVIMDAVQCGSSGRWHPGSASPCHELADLVLEHGLHAVRLCPHALADLAPAW